MKSSIKLKAQTEILHTLEKGNKTMQFLIMVPLISKRPLQGTMALKKLYYMNQRRSFQDAAFLWARQNPVAARKALTVPPDNRSTITSLTSLEDYLNQRKWDVLRHPHSIALVSHVMSAPLTMWHAFEEYCGSASSFEEHVTARQKWCVIGARAEATLPSQYWREILQFERKREWSIEFCGPDVRPSSKPVTLQKEDNNSQLTLTWSYRGYFHEKPHSQQSITDVYFLFNPGLGHANLKKDWIPTLNILLEEGSSCCLTAHSELDAERDVKMLQEQGFGSVAYQPNPFVSRISYQDPFDSHHFVSPNKYVAWIGK